MKETTKKFISYLLNRKEQDEYIDIVFWNDAKKRDNVFDHYYQIENSEQIEKLILKRNEQQRYAAGYMLNPLHTPKRLSENVNRILNVAIDIDGGNEQDKYVRVKAELERLGIKTVLEDKSQNGFHFIIPIEAEKEFSMKVERFLKGLKENIHEDVDTINFDPARFFRLPETLNNKQEPPVLLETIYFNTNISPEEISSNTSAILRYAEEIKLKSDAFESIISQGMEFEEHEADVFFDTILNDKKLMKYIAEKDGIEKNNVLFKNLSIYLKSHKEMEEQIYEFVEMSGHTKAEFYGWVKKDMFIVNYAELKNWVFDYELDDLKPLIKEQLKNKLKFLENYKVIYITSAKDHRYMLYDLRSGHFTLNREGQLVEAVKYISSKENIDLYEELNINIFDEETGQVLGQKKLMNRILEKLLRLFDETDLLIPVYDFGYKPCNDMFFEDFGKRYFNTYNPGPLEFYEEKKDKYEFPYVERLLKHLTTSKLGYEYFNKWLAFILINPLTKLPSSIIFKGTQGTGKGRLREWILPAIWGNNNIEEINDTNLKNIWGDYIKCNRFVVANEINLMDSNSNSAYKRIKEYSTDKEVSIQQKGKPIEKIHNYTHWIFFSDQEMPIKLDGEDRRHTVFHQETPISPDIVMKLSPEINPGYLEQEMREYVSYLRSLNPKFDDVYKFLPTKEKSELIGMSKDTIDAFMEELRNYKDIKSFAEDYGSILAFNVDADFSEVIPTKDLYDLYITWCLKNHYKFQKTQISFGMSLSKVFKINSIRKQIKGISKSVYIVTQILEGNKPAKEEDI